MRYTVTVSPDFTPNRIAGWYIFNTWLQKTLGVTVRLAMHNSFDEHRAAIAADKIDLIYANPYDAATLVREKGFVSLATAEGKADEVILAARAGADIRAIEDLAPGARIARTDDPDVNMVGMIMLEPANLDAENTTVSELPTYVVVAKQLIQNQADVGFFLKDAFNDLSPLVKKQLVTLVASQIDVIRHAFMLGPRMADLRKPMMEALLNMPNTGKGRDALRQLGFVRWKAMLQEDTEFMIDLMDTLVD